MNWWMMSMEYDGWPHYSCGREFPFHFRYHCCCYLGETVTCRPNVEREHCTVWSFLGQKEMMYSCWSMMKQQGWIMTEWRPCSQTQSVRSVVGRRQQHRRPWTEASSALPIASLSQWWRCFSVWCVQTLFCFLMSEPLIEMWKGKRFARISLGWVSLFLPQQHNNVGETSTLVDTASSS